DSVAHVSIKVVRRDIEDSEVVAGCSCGGEAGGVEGRSCGGVTWGIRVGSCGGDEGAFIGDGANVRGAITILGGDEK
nr:hypothetical protein [Tanacetum cinerariifolium]